jgi:hypothetical protein
MVSLKPNNPKYVMKKHTKKPKSPNYRQLPRWVWQKAKQYLPQKVRNHSLGRSWKPNRAVMNSLWFVLWIDSQCKAIDRTWFGVSSSVLHERFQTWQQQELWEKIF